MKISTMILAFTFTILSLFSSSTGFAATNADSATLNVIAVPAFPSFSSFAIYRLSGPTSAVSFGPLGAPVTFAGLEPGTYTVEVNDFGAVIDAPQEGTAVVTLGPGEFAFATVQLQGVGQPLPVFPFFF